VTIMAASVPFLRLIVKEVSSSTSRGNKLQKSPPTSHNTTMFGTLQQQDDLARTFGPEGKRNIRRVRESSIDRELKDIMEEEDEDSGSSRRGSAYLPKRDIEDAAGINKARYMLEGGRMSRFSEMDT